MTTQARANLIREYLEKSEHAQDCLDKLAAELTHSKDPADLSVFAILGCIQVTSNSILKMLEPIANMEIQKARG